MARFTASWRSATCERSHRIHQLAILICPRRLLPRQYPSHDHILVKPMTLKHITKISAKFNSSFLAFGIVAKLEAIRYIMAGTPKSSQAKPMSPPVRFRWHDDSKIYCQALDIIRFCRISISGRCCAIHNISGGPCIMLGGFGAYSSHILPWTDSSCSDVKRFPAVKYPVTCQGDIIYMIALSPTSCNFSINLYS